MHPADQVGDHRDLLPESVGRPLPPHDPKQDLREISDLLEAGDSGLVIVAVDHKGTDITPLLGDAQKKKIIETQAGNVEEEFNDALETAQAAQAK